MLRTQVAFLVVLAGTLSMRAFAVCPDDGCEASNATNTFPVISASLSNGLLQVDATSFGAQWMLIGANEDDNTGTSGQTTCAPSSKSGDLSTSVECVRQLNYEWNWDTITADQCSGSTVTPDDGTVISREVTLMVVDSEISGQTLTGTSCMNIFHTFRLIFEFPTTVTHNGTIEMFSQFREGHALVDNLSHDLDAGLTHGTIYLTLSHPFRLADSEIDDPTTLPTGIEVSDVSLTKTSESEDCTNMDTGFCEYTFDFTITESVCEDGVDPYGQYVFPFTVVDRDGYDLVGYEESHTLSFDIPQLVECDFDVFVGQASLAPFTGYINDDTTFSQTTQFYYQQTITLRIPVLVDFYTPTAGRLEYLRVCEKATLSAARNEGCGGTFESISHQPDETYSTSSGFALVDTGANFFRVEDAGEPQLEVSFYYDAFNNVGDAATPNAFSFLRYEILVVELRFSNDADNKKGIDDDAAQEIFPRTFASGAVSVKRSTGEATLFPTRAERSSRTQHEHAASPATVVVYRTDYSTLAVVAVVAAVGAFVVRSRRNQLSRGILLSAEEEEDNNALL